MIYTFGSETALQQLWVLMSNIALTLHQAAGGIYDILETEFLGITLSDLFTSPAVLVVVVSAAILKSTVPVI